MCSENPSYLDAQDADERREVVAKYAEGSDAMSAAVCAAADSLVDVVADITAEEAAQSLLDIGYERAIATYGSHMVRSPAGKTVTFSSEIKKNVAVWLTDKDQLHMFYGCTMREAVALAIAAKKAFDAEKK